MNFNYNFTSGSINRLLTPTYKIKHFCKHSQDINPRAYFFNSTASQIFVHVVLLCLFARNPELSPSYQHHV